MRTDTDHIAFTGDGHAWLILPAETHLEGYVMHTIDNWARVMDRPCDECYGAGAVAGGFITCDCVGRRHSFNIEVVARDPHGCIGKPGQCPSKAFCTMSVPCLKRKPDMRRVSVVPGMVLPIEADSPSPGYPRVIMRDDGKQVLAEGRKLSIPDQFPSAAVPGGWAVQLKVAS